MGNQECQNFTSFIKRFSRRSILYKENSNIVTGNRLVEYCFGIRSSVLQSDTRILEYSLTSLPEDLQQQIIRETFHLVSKRDDNVCNFLEGGTLIGGSDYKLIYRHYATLYFVFCVDSSESELGILDLIQVFVETLDKCFENVCELDLIFHVDKVHYILGELVMGGMVLETNMTEIMTRIEEQNKLEKSEV
ncbi:AP-3 complex subunit sigma-2-like isoform X1 [Mytilus californianus]|uniref:AP-3 complex subunit sigma-2-like isoform X1 n=1 Tax=Mytilus californianus TaxID=6549 RepID=UPI002247CEFF|nr:AP-3 complex subunit sigma-2-like isoform X1 [Mytilus californianus]